MEQTRGHFENCIVWAGLDLEPMRCRVFSWEEETVTKMEVTEPVTNAEGVRCGIVPGFVNAHTHIGDAFLPEAAVDRTLEEAFFRPQGYKYRALEEVTADEHIQHMAAFQREMAAGGTVAHVDFREQGAEGARRLRRASAQSGVHSVILSQFADPPQSGSVLDGCEATLTPAHVAELEGMLEVADGFSESTMNDLTDAAWKQIQESTDAAGKARAVHCLESPAYRDTSMTRTGRGDLIRALEILQPDLVVHLTVANEEEIQYVTQSGVPVVLNVRANMALGLPAPPVARLLKAGATLLAGTDNGILNGPDLFRELDALFRLACSQAGEAHRPRPVDILKMVTSNMSRTRWRGELPGVLREGGPATFAVVDLSAPHYQRSQELTGTLITRGHPGDVCRTLLHGRELYAREES